MISRSFARIAIVTASTHKPGARAGGVSGDFVAGETDFKCTPLAPLTPEVAAMVGLENFAELLITFCEGGLDIDEKHIFITGGVTYKIKSVADWYWTPAGSDNLAIVLEQPK